MNTARSLVVFALALGMLVLVGTLLLLGISSAPSPVHASPGTLYVAPDGSDAQDCSSLANRCRTVQHVVDVAAEGDEIHVATGIYTGVQARADVTQVVYVSKTVTIRGGYNADFSAGDPDISPTILDAEGKGRVLYITGNISPVIEGLRLTGGDATGLGGYDYYGTYDVGGGIYVITAAATLNHNQMFSNTAPYGGGGVFLGYSAAKLNNNTIVSNAVTTGGGGLFLYNSAATLDANTIVSNTSANLGGGVYLFDSDATFKGNVIRSNTATSLGGGIDVASCSPTFSGNVISGNSSGRGGGLFLWYSRSLLTNNVLADNRADTVGSGVWIGGSTPYLMHTTFARNTGGVGDAVFVTDDGSGAYSDVVMTNTLLVSQTVGITATTGTTNAVTLNGILWYSNTTNYGGPGAVTVTHAITGNPAFSADGFHITPASAAINGGLNTGVSTDIDNDPRLGQPDLGADEWVTRVFLPLALKQ